MANIQDILNALESIAPARLASSFDKVGLQVGCLHGKVKKAVVSLDRSLAAIHFSAKHEAELLIAHHPLIWNPLAEIRSDEHVGKTVMELIRHGMSFIAVHTNWDRVRGGLNDVLAEKLKLKNITPFGSCVPSKEVKLVVYVPREETQNIIDILSMEGAGSIGNYERCAAYAPVTGTFIPTGSANPAIGQLDEIETVQEDRIEMILPIAKMEAVRRALIESHPYEEPAYEFVKIEPVYENPIGRIGTLEESLSLHGLALFTEKVLSTRVLAWGKEDKLSSKIAVTGGAAAEEWHAAQKAGAEVLITGEVPQHIALEASEHGFSVIAAGHYGTEQPGVERLYQKLQEALPHIEWLLYAPEPGKAGRPFFGNYLK